jgi:predicted PurR-regulated permease PerM
MESDRPLPRTVLRPPIMPGPRAGGTQTLVALAVIIGALYFGRDVLVPLALAGLLSFALAPVIAALRRRGIPRTPSVITVVMLAFLGIFLFGFVVAGQVSQLGASLPRYEYNIREKIRSLQSSAPGGGLIERAAEALRDLRQDIERATEAPAEGEGASPVEPEAAEPEPIPVQIRQPDPAPLQMLQTIVGPLIEPLTTTGIVIVLVVFMLLQREDLRDRFIRLVGSRDLHRTTQALGDAADRVGRYLLMQLLVNVAYGIPIGIGLWLIGVPNPLLWGMLSLVLRFVPFIGPIIAAAFPLALSIAVDPGWTMLLWTAALFIFLELISGNIVEPWVYGASTGLSSIAILAAAIFWTWLWGPVGLLLSTPLTVCLVVLGRHVPQFGFLNVLLGSEPVLEPAESLYQRLLAGDPDEATERAEEYLKSHSILEYYEDVVIPALSMFEHDRARGVLTDERRELVAAAALTLVDNLSDHEDTNGREEVGEVGAEQALPERALPETIEPGVGWRDRPVLCGGGRGNLDDVAAAILAQLLERCGIGTRVAPHEAITTGAYANLDMTGVEVVCLSYMNPDSIAHARYAVRRLRRRTSVPIVLGFWSVDPADPKRPDLVTATKSDISVTSLGGAIEEIVGLALTRAASADTAVAG